MRKMHREVFFQWCCRGCIRSYSFVLRVVGDELVAGCSLKEVTQTLD